MVHVGLVLLLLFLLPGQCWGFSADVFLRAAAATGIPVEMLLAVSHVESGFHPHAINILGESFLPSSESEALRLLLRSRSNVDIGLMQVNWGYWDNKFGLSKSELLDPQLTPWSELKFLSTAFGSVEARGAALKFTILRMVFSNALTSKKSGSRISLSRQKCGDELPDIA
jgi:hypothetical protein